jgi:uncharacterized protein with HEPN domain
MSRREAPPDETALIDIVQAARQIVALTQGLTAEAFAADARTHLAVLHLLVILGEAVKRLSPGIREVHPEIPWRQATGMRDFLVHEYDAVNLHRVLDRTF